MVFSSLVFLLGFLPSLMLIYYLIPRRFRWLRNLVLLGYSLGFYWWGANKLVALMVLSIVINYVGGLLAGQNRKGVARLGVLFASVAGALACWPGSNTRASWPRPSMTWASSSPFPR